MWVQFDSFLAQGFVEQLKLVSIVRNPPTDSTATAGPPITGENPLINPTKQQDCDSPSPRRIISAEATATEIMSCEKKNFDIESMLFYRLITSFLFCRPFLCRVFLSTIVPPPRLNSLLAKKKRGTLPATAQKNEARALQVLLCLHGSLRNQKR